MKQVADRSASFDSRSGCSRSFSSCWPCCSALRPLPFRHEAQAQRAGRASRSTSCSSSTTRAACSRRTSASRAARCGATTRTSCASPARRSSSRAPGLRLPAASDYQLGVVSMGDNPPELVSPLDRAGPGTRRAGAGDQQPAAKAGDADRARAGDGLPRAARVAEPPAGQPARGRAADRRRALPRRGAEQRGHRAPGRGQPRRTAVRHPAAEPATGAPTELRALHPLLG